MGRMLLVRHGQASFGTDDYDRLSPVGHQQARRLGEWLVEQGVPAPGVVLTGGLRRQVETADGLLEGSGWSGARRVDPAWDEFDAGGVMAALPGFAQRVGELGERAGFQRLYVEATERWTAGVDDGDYTETWTGFRARVAGALARAVEAAGEGDVLVVSSGGPITLVVAELTLASATGADAALPGVWGTLSAAYVNTGLSSLLLGRTGPRLSTFNEHTHLAGDVTYR